MDTGKIPAIDDCKNNTHGPLAQFQCELRVFLHIGKEYVEIKDERSNNSIHKCKACDLKFYYNNGNNITLHFGGEGIFSLCCENIASLLTKLQALQKETSSFSPGLSSSSSFQEPRSRTLGSHKRERVATDQNDKIESSPTLKHSTTMGHQRGESNHKNDIIEDLSHKKERVPTGHQRGDSNHKNDIEDLSYKKERVPTDQNDFKTENSPILKYNSTTSHQRGDNNNHKHDVIEDLSPMSSPRDKPFPSFRRSAQTSVSPNKWERTKVSDDHSDSDQRNSTRTSRTRPLTSREERGSRVNRSSEVKTADTPSSTQSLSSPTGKRPLRPAPASEEIIMSAYKRTVNPTRPDSREPESREPDSREILPPTPKKLTLDLVSPTTIEIGSPRTRQELVVRGRQNSSPAVPSKMIRKNKSPSSPTVVKDVIQNGDTMLNSKNSNRRKILDRSQITSPTNQHNDLYSTDSSSVSSMLLMPKQLKKQRKQVRLSMYIAKKEREELFKLIMHMQAEKTAENEKVILAALEKHTKLRGDINELSECDQTILYLACTLGNVYFVEFLLRLDGIQLDGIQDKVTGSTPLHGASCSGSTEIVAILLARGAVPELSADNLLPEQELANSRLDKEKKKRMEELWRVYDKSGKKGLQKFLPDGKTLADYKVPERQATLEEILIGLTRNDEETQPIVWTGPTGDTLTVEVKDILLTHRLYCTSEDLSFLLKKRITDANNNPAEFTIHKGILNILKHWIHKMWYDFVDDENLYTKIETLLQTLAISPHQEISKIATKVMMRLKTKEHVLLSDIFIPLIPKQRQPDVSILSFYPLVIVQHLNAIDVSLWRKVRPSDCWNKKKIECLLNWSTHFPQWVVSEILQGETLSQRIEITNSFFDIAEGLWRQTFCNLNSLLSILDSLNKFSNTVIFKGIAEEKINKFKALLKLFEKNFSYCSEQIKSRVRDHTPFIPPVAVYNYFALRWSEKPNSKTKVNKILVTLNQMKNAVPYMDALLMLHENAAKLQTATQQKIIDLLTSKPLPDEVQKSLLRDLNSPEYITEEWHGALKRSDIPTVKILLKHNPLLLKSLDSSGRTPLHYAAFHNSETLLRVLLLFDRSFPFCVTIEDKVKESPLHVASKNGYNNILSLLLSYHEIWLLKETSQLSSTNVRSREDITERRNQHRISQKYMHGGTALVWDTWVMGGSKALEAENYAVITQDIMNQTAKNRLCSVGTVPSSRDRNIPLLDWALFSAKIPTSNTTLGKAYLELVTTEGEYLHDLVLILRQIKPFLQDNPHTQQFESEILFKGIDTLIMLHKEFYEELLSLTELDIECISVLFSQKAEIFKTFYSLYGKDYNKRLHILFKLKQSTKSYNKYCVKLDGVSVPIDSFMIKPIQRIAKYPILLNQMCNGINHPDSRECLRLAQLKMTEVSTTINDEIERAQAEKILNNLSAKIIRPDRHIITCGKLTIWSSIRKKPLTFILFSDRLMGFSKGKENFLTINKLEWKVEEDFYIQKIISVTTDEEDESAFKIHLYSEDGVLLKANGVEEMQKWIQKINKVKEQWLSEHGPVELAKQLASGLTQEQISKFWRVNDKKNAKAWITLGDLYRKSCKYQESIECYTNVIEHDDKNVQYLALYKQAKAYSKIQKKEQEIECLKNALNIINYVPQVDMKVVVNVIQLLQKHNIPSMSNPHTKLNVHQ